MIADRLLRHSTRRRDERGVTLVIVAMFMVALLFVAALVIDIGRMRSRGQSMQTAADLSALAATTALRNSDITGACQAAVNYFNTNVSGSSITASTMCSQSGNDVATTTCSGGTLGEAKPSATVNGVTLSIHYPVPDSEISSSGIVGARVNDGTACQRLRVVITDSQAGFFSGVTGHGNLTATRSATVRVQPGSSNKAPALWLLDPTGCTSLSVVGGSSVNVGTTSVGGLITVDSDGTTCQSSQKTIDTGGGSYINATGNPADPAMITLDALPRNSTVCVLPACNPSDVSNGQISPQPIAAGYRATRAPVDWQFNCKSSYPNYHGIAVSGCTKGNPAYMDLLRSAVGTTVGTPPFASYTRWSSLYNCNSPNNLPPVLTGNWWIDCTGSQGLRINNGTNVNFSNGNVVMDGPLTMSGGSISFNSNGNAAPLPPACVPPNVTTLVNCKDISSSNAAFVFSRNGAWSMTGGTLHAEGVTVVLNGSNAYLKMSANPPVWHAPTDGPFAGLAFWSEAPSSQYQVNGGSGASLSGIFFVPEATPFSLNGQSAWGQQAAQFIAYQVSVGGGGSISISPNQQAVTIVPPVTTLIR
jgi:Flp pilus assembly protein TadG